MKKSKRKAIGKSIAFKKRQQDVQLNASPLRKSAPASQTNSKLVVADQHSSRNDTENEAAAAAYGDDENEVIKSIDSKARKVLECPFIVDLRKGTCGSQFSEAFLCFLKSTEEEKVFV